MKKYQKFGLIVSFLMLSLSAYGQEPLEKTKKTDETPKSSLAELTPLTEQSGLSEHCVIEHDDEKVKIIDIKNATDDEEKSLSEKEIEQIKKMKKIDFIDSDGIYLGTPIKSKHDGKEVNIIVTLSNGAKIEYSNVLIVKSPLGKIKSVSGGKDGVYIHKAFDYSESQMER